MKNYKGFTIEPVIVMTIYDADGQLFGDCYGENDEDFTKAEDMIDEWLKK